MDDLSHVLRWRVSANVMVPMRDGVRLATSVFVPREDGRYPVVLLRTAYNRCGIGDAGLAGRGLAVVVQDCRGRYGSDGEFYPFIHEPADGWDTLEWIAKQPWCNGRIGMFGDSYLAAVQFAVAPLGSPHLAALNPRFMAGDLWRHAYYCDGAFSLALTFSWLCLEVGSRTSEAGLLPHADIAALLRRLPLGSLDEAFGRQVPAYRDAVKHDSPDAYWERVNYRRTLGKANVPLLLTGGWYDYYPGETFHNYRALLDGDAPPELKQSHRVIVGPYTHGFPGSSRLGQLDFGIEALRENDSSARWMECLLKGGTAREFQKAPIRLFVMGANQWRDEQEWPLARTRWQRLYLRSGGRANSLFGDGALSPEPPGDERPDRYTYDPENPVPTLGGNHSVGPYNPGLYELCLPGPYDQRPIERRDDVLVFTSGELSEDLDVTGPVALRLFAASSAVDTDFTARLTDVYPDGRSINLTEGVIRARFRDRSAPAPSLIEPGRVYEYEIELQPTSNVFRKGHRIRLDVTSSNFPLWDRNPNTGEPPATARRTVAANQVVHHGRSTASHLILPVIPAIGDTGE